MFAGFEEALVLPVDADRLYGEMLANGSLLVNKARCFPLIFREGAACVVCVLMLTRAHLNVRNSALKDSLTSREVREKAPRPLCAPHCYSDIMWHFIRK